MGRQTMILLILGFMMGSWLAGCSRDMFGGAAIGAAGAGAAYEYQNKRQMDLLEEDFKAGKIDEDEYNKRKDQIGRGSLIY